MSESFYPERRSGVDRRQVQSPPHSLSSLFGSRRLARRKEDRERPYYVDQYRTHLLLVFLCAVSLSIVDAFLTMHLIHAGASELNPIMDFFLKWGPFHFLLAKYLLTVGGLTMVLVHKEFTLFSRQIKGKDIFVTVPILYLVLVIYELVLLF